MIKIDDEISRIGDQIISTGEQMPRIDDQVLAIFQAVAEGMDYRQREEVIRILRNPPTGRTPADLVQLLDFKEIIDELTQVNEAYRKRDWQDIDGNELEQVKKFRETYLRLHRAIVDYSLRIEHGDFSLEVLDNYDSIQERIVLEDRLTEKRMEIKRKWGFYHEVAAMPHQLKQLPEFNLQGAKDYGGALVVKKTDPSGEVTEMIMRNFLDEGDDEDREYLHAKFFLAELFKEEQPARIEALTAEADNFEGSFQKATNSERQKLTAFKRNQDPKYCTQNYQIAYNGWCLNRFRNLVR